MAVDYLLAEDGDLDLTNGSMSLTKTIEQSSKQQAIISLNTYRGEWDFNILAGIPWLINENNTTQVLGKSTKALIDTVVQEDILNRENITEIISYESILNKSTRVLTISFEALTNQGSVISVSDSTQF
jgi:hypothetical protein